ncbi:MAG: hypothetical protein A2X56_00135 [Nitrospirae bacterium GWC2_57_13]|nr:MAG: hypothetical protein A2X56_00135 [Nitrospirae bacterium GWC2_57_13]HAR45888.1 hypothetical protein [Nitrospiraceae bacterium]
MLFLRRCILILLFMLTLLSTDRAVAGDLREIVLSDGSTMIGEVVSLQNGLYTVKSPALGTITVPERKIRSIRTLSGSESATGGSATSSVDPAALGQIGSLQKQMMGNEEIMDLIRSLQDDPDFQKILRDPAVMAAVGKGDIATLTANPAFMKLLNNATIGEIRKKVQE